jgi:hypothetical protein
MHPSVRRDLERMAFNVVTDCNHKSEKVSSPKLPPEKRAGDYEYRRSIEMLTAALK